MIIKHEIFPKYFIMDILPVKESLESEYEDFGIAEIIDTELYKYVDLDDNDLYSPRLQLVLDISDGKNVYLTKFDGCGYHSNKLDQPSTGFKYTLHLKIYPDSSRFALITKDDKIIKSSNKVRIPSSFVEKNDNIIFDNYINLEIKGSKVINFSNETFFNDIEKIFN